MARIRTFVAIEIPNDVRDRTVRLIDKLSDTTDSVRWVDPENLHVTVKFLGDVDDTEIYQVCRSVADATSQHASFVANCESLGAFPKLEKPRTVWLGVHDEQDQLISLFQSVDESLKKSMGFPLEVKQIRPHLTLGRLRYGRKDTAELTEQIKSLAEYQAGAVPVDELIIFASELTRQGPVYNVLGRAALG